MPDSVVDDKKDDKLVINLELKEVARQAREFAEKQKKQITKIQAGKPWMRKIWVPNKSNGRPYYQEVRYYYDNEGKRRLEILKHLGNRKPRRIKTE